MSAYATQQREQSPRLLQLEPLLPHPDPSAAKRNPSDPVAAIVGRSRAGIDGTAIIEVLLDHLAERLAEAVVARLGNERIQQDEWLDSREAAEYLGLHRDTLRRLAAAHAIQAEQDGRGCKLFFRRTALDEWRRSGGRSHHLAAFAEPGVRQPFRVGHRHAA